MVFGWVGQETRDRPRDSTSELPTTLKFRLLRPPIAESVDDARAYIEPYLATAFDGVIAGFDLRRLSDPVRPYLSVHLDRSAVSTVIVCHRQISFPVL